MEAIMEARCPHLAPAANRQREAIEATKHVSAILTMKRRQPHLARQQFGSNTFIKCEREAYGGDQARQCNVNNEKATASPRTAAKPQPYIY